MMIRDIIEITWTRIERIIYVILTRSRLCISLMLPIVAILYDVENKNR